MELSSTLPERVTLVEVGPRDGFQSEELVLPTETKVSVINALIAAGISEIQVASFVHPTWVPQVADAEAVCESLSRDSDVTYIGLALNSRGVQRAHKAGLKDLELSISTTETQSLRNANMSLDESIDELFEMIDLCHKYDIRVRAGLQCVWGCHGESHPDVRFLPELARRIVSAGVDSLSLADSTGSANPRSVSETISRTQDAIGNTPLVMHFHDTRGLALANVMAALDKGITKFDTSVVGMGGCPFIPGATGNVATADVAYMLESMGVSTGLDLARLATVGEKVESLYGKRFPGRVHDLIRRHGIEAIAVPG